MIERAVISRLYHLDHLYGLLLTFGLALIIEGLFRQQYGSRACPTANPTPGRHQSRLHVPAVLPGWVVVFSLAVCLATWFMIEKTKLGVLPARRHRGPDLVQAFGINVPRMITLTYGFGVALAALAGVLAAPIYSVNPVMGAEPHHRRLRRGGDRRHGLDPRLDPDRLRPRRRRGPDQGVLPGGLEHGDLHHHGDRAA